MSDMIDQDESPDPTPHCPVCGDPNTSGPCPHLVSTWDYTEESGFWEAEPGPMAFREVVVALLDAVARGFTEPQQQVLAALLALPPEMQPALAASIRDGDFCGGSWTGYLSGVAEAGRTHAGSAECETDTPGSCSSWTSHWAKNPMVWARSVGAALKRTVRDLERVTKEASRLPSVEG